MIDLDLRRIRAAHELDSDSGVGIVEDPAQDRTPVGVGFDHHIDKVAAQDVVAGVTSIAPAGNRDVVGPGLAEEAAVIAGLGCTSLDRQGIELGANVAGRGQRIGGYRWYAGERAHTEGRRDKEPTGGHPARTYPHQNAVAIAIYSAINAAPSNQFDSPSKVTSTATNADITIAASSKGDSTRSNPG